MRKDYTQHYIIITEFTKDSLFTWVILYDAFHMSHVHEKGKRLRTLHKNSLDYK